MLKTYFKFIIIFLILLNTIYSQVLRTPSEVIDIQRILRLKQQFQNQIFTPEEILPLVDQELQNYFKQFRDERLLKDSIVSIPYDYFNFPLNKIHTLIYIRSFSDIQKKHRLFSPYLYETFLLKAKLYEKLNQSQNALSHYLQALQYTIPILDPSIEEIDSKSLFPISISIENLEQYLDNKQLKEKLNYFEYWNATFGDENYIKELLDLNFKSNIEVFKKIFQEFKSNLVDIKNIKKDYYKADLNNNIVERRNKSIEFQNKWNEIKEQWNQLLQLEQKFKEEQKKLKKDYANILFSMANLMKEIEYKNKERERLLNQSSYYRGTGNALGINKTLYREFIGYKRLLELAHNLDPENIEYIDLLSDEYFREKNPVLGLKIEKKWFQYADKKDRRNPKHYFRIMSYYLNTKNISLAAKFIDELYNYLKQNSEYQSEIFIDKENLFLDPYEHFLFFYYDFYLKHYSTIKNEEDFENNFNIILNKLTIKLDNTKNIIEKSNGYQLKYKILYNLAKYERINKNYQKEMNYLIEIYNLENLIESEIQNLENKKNNLEKEQLRIKQTLYYEENLELTQKLFEIEKIELPNINNQIQSLKIVKNSFPMGKILERIAYLNYINKDFNNAILFYNKILEHKNINTIYKKRSMENIKIIQKNIQTGFNY
ncbi:MAG: hypothetical protein KatS3mg083_620 [Candidatus Dojkabacteria bacterium]|nr:MAG: hypothetical protein KatS3mg083_620 [Candidatus Dojkabacteria bacterium]